MKKPSLFKQLVVINQQTGLPSYRKVHANIGLAICSIGFSYYVYKGLANNELWLYYGLIVIGSTAVDKLLTLKYGQGAKPTTGEDDVGK